MMSALLSLLLPSSATLDRLHQMLERFLAYAQTQFRLEQLIAVLALLVVWVVLKWPDCAIGTTSRPDLKGDRGLPLIGNFFQFMRYKSNLLEYFVEQHQRYPQGYTMTVPGAGRFIMVNKPELLEYVQKGNFDNYQKQDIGGLTEDVLGNGIFVSNGEQWRVHRKTASNMFTARLYRDSVQHAFKTSAEELGRVLVKKMSQGEGTYINLQKEFVKLTLDAFGRITFGIDFQALSSDEPSDFNDALDYISNRLVARFGDPFWRLEESLIPPLRRRIRGAVGTLDRYAYMAIEGRRKEDPEAKEARRKDMLDHFINYEFEDGSKLPDKQLRDVFLNFMFAGRDTTSQALAWQFYLLLSHPKVEAKLRQEIDFVLQGSDEYTYELLTRDMTYTKAVFYETLRLYPPVPVSGVIAANHDTLPDGTRVGPKDIVGFSTYCMSREPSLWGPDASEFNPDRWLTPDPQAKSPFGKFKNESPYKFNVFNAGPRTCLGQTFATLEAMVTTIHLLQHFDIRLKPNHPVPTLVLFLTSGMAHPLEVSVSKRQP